MNAAEIGRLLAEITAVDRRPVDESVVLAWLPLVDDLDYAEAVEAVRLHFRDSTEYLKPAHVRAGVERIRLAALGPREDEYGNTLDPDVPAVEAARRLSRPVKEISR